MLLPGDKRLATAGHMRGYTLSICLRKFLKKFPGRCPISFLPILIGV